MYCIECGKELHGDSKYCTVCGMSQIEIDKNFAKKKVVERTLESRDNGNSIFNSVFKLCIIIILAWAAYSVHSISANKNDVGRYISGDNVILDTKTGTLWMLVPEENNGLSYKHKMFSPPINP